MYEISRNIYATTSADYSDESRISILQGTLAQLRLTNIATLDACMNHFTRLIDLTSADEEYVTALANILAPCILRPRIETSLTMEEKHAYRLIRDLFQFKEPIFTELKRMSTNSGSLGGGPGGRPRAISTDESNRRANVEERNRLLLEKSQGIGSRSRATSPAPSPRTGHRRDRSVGGPETRFPIQTSPTSSGDRQRASLGSVVGGVAAKRQSLEPPEPGMDSPQERGRATERYSQPPPAIGPEGGESLEGLEESPLEKRNSLGRGGARFVGGRRVTASSGSGNPEISGAPRGITLEDKPMED